MKYEVLYKTPLELGSIIAFNTNQATYKGKVVSEEKSKYYVVVKEKIESRKIIERSHAKLVEEIFKCLNTTPIQYYEKVLGENVGLYSVWPETSLEDLEKVLAAMKSDFEALNTNKIDPSKFRFRIGDKVFVEKTPYKIAGYYFSDEFNNYDMIYGYVIEGIEGEGNKGSMFGYDEYGNHLAPSTKNDRFYISENRVSEYKANKKEQNIKKDGNEIKLQRTKAFIRTATVPTGYRIRCKIHKASISSQSLSYTEITS